MGLDNEGENEEITQWGEGIEILVHEVLLVLLAWSSATLSIGKLGCDLAPYQANCTNLSLILGIYLHDEQCG
jgi:hypothetical protein